jgi:MFS family permease
VTDATVPDAMKVPSLAIAMIFAANGFITGSWAAQIPFLKAQLGVGPSGFSIVLLAVAVGAVLAMPTVGVLAARFGLWRILAILSLAYPFVPLLTGSGAPFMAIALFALTLGAINGSMDVCMNVMGVEIEKARIKPFLSRLHGTWSLALFAGSGAGSWIAARYGLQTHALLVMGVGLLLVSSLWPLRHYGQETVPNAGFVIPDRATIGIGFLTFLALMVEGAVIDWAAIFMSLERGVPKGEAGWALAVFAGSMAVARFTGDMLRERFGAAAVVLWCSIGAALGMALAALVPSWPMLLAGFALAGLAIGNIAPILFAAGGYIDKANPARGIAAITTMGYAGFLVGPPVIGFVAETSNFASAFVLLGGLSLVCAFLAIRLVRPHLG